MLLLWGKLLDDVILNEAWILDMTYLTWTQVYACMVSSRSVDIYCENVSKGLSALFHYPDRCGLNPVHDASAQYQI